MRGLGRTAREPHSSSFSSWNILRRHVDTLEDCRLVPDMKAWTSRTLLLYSADYTVSSGYNENRALHGVARFFELLQGVMKAKSR